MKSKLQKSMKIFVSKVTIVTRSSKGIEKFIAYELARNGFDVVVNSRNQKDTSKVVKDLEKEFEIKSIEIAAEASGNANSSPIWRIFMIGWENPQNAALLETKADIDAYQAEGLISVGLARPMDSDHIVNCPFIDPFQ